MIFSKRISRGKVLELVAAQSSYTAALEAWGEHITLPVGSSSLAMTFS